VFQERFNTLALEIAKYVGVEVDPAHHPSVGEVEGWLRNWKENDDGIIEFKYEFFVFKEIFEEDFGLKFD
jgi:hypothetical protein